MRNRNGEDALRMPGTADLVKCINHGILVLSLKCNVKINGGVSRWVTQVLPVHRDRIPVVLHMDVIPR